jgi:hypothetical protein
MNNIISDTAPARGALPHRLGHAVRGTDGRERASLAEGPVTGDGLSGVRPLTTTFDYNACGRGLYSSYHTLGRDPLTRAPAPSRPTARPASCRPRAGPST